MLLRARPDCRGRRDLVRAAILPSDPSIRSLARARLANRKAADGGVRCSGEAIPIWGNEWAVSWEPFLNFELAPGESREWSVSYSFGEPAASRM